MTTDKKIYGRIDCAVCGFENGMRITADKNGAPFGFCDANCDSQLRIGGSARRVREFFKKYPDIEAAFNPVTEQKETQKPVTVTEVKQAQKPVTVTEQKAPKKSGFDMEL